MTRLQAIAAAVLVVATHAASACELVLSGHRDGTERLRVAMSVAMPHFEIRFVHSVLGTVVIDRYEVRDTGEVHLVEEQFAGEGYGLPAAAAPGETLTQVGEMKRLRLDRPVHPLVVRPLRAQQMALHVGDAAWLLADLSTSTAAIELSPRGCR